MTYNPSIPQPGDYLSDSQGQMLQNFSVSNTSFGKDHFPFADLTVNNGLHKQATFPDMSATPPSPAAGYGAEFAKTINSATYPFWVRDGSVNQYPALPIKAYALFLAGVVPTSVFTLPYGNVASITRTGTGVYVITFVDPFPNTNYGILALPQDSAINVKVQPTSTSTATIKTSGIDYGVNIMVTMFF